MSKTACKKPPLTLIQNDDAAAALQAHVEEAIDFLEGDAAHKMSDQPRNIRLMGHLTEKSRTQLELIIDKRCTMRMRYMTPAIDRLEHVITDQLKMIEALNARISDTGHALMAHQNSTRERFDHVRVQMER